MEGSTEPLAGLPGPVVDVVETALGRAHRDDPVDPGSGGPAGNARLTAWLGLLLLAAFLAECATLVSLHELVGVHILLGALLVPLVLLKTATTGWRILGYYTGRRGYRHAGPPPLLLRALGPLVVLTGLAVLGTGLALVALGQATFDQLTSVAGFRIDALTVHQAAFVAWLVVTALHVLARTIPAAQLAAGRTSTRQVVPGSALRVAVLVLTLAVGVGVGLVVLHLAGSWTTVGTFRPGPEGVAG